jgi:YbgC/YbaW family acyl-CoA thioester hydrolase
MTGGGMSGPEKLSEIHVSRRVQFYETDAAGIVHFSWYFRYMEEAEHALWRAAGLSIAPPGSEFGFPRVAVSCDYKAPLRFEDEFDTHIRIVTMTDKSLRYACQVTLGDVLVATLGMTIVCVITRPDGSMRGASLPAWIRDRLEATDDVGA